MPFFIRLRAHWNNVLTIRHLLILVLLGLLSGLPVWGQHIGAGSKVRGKAVIEPEASLGENVIVKRQARIKAKAIIGNDVIVGRRAVINNGSVIADNAVVRNRVVVGSSDVCTLDFEPSGRLISIPPTVVRANTTIRFRIISKESIAELNQAATTDLLTALLAGYNSINAGIEGKAAILLTTAGFNPGAIDMPRIACEYANTINSLKNNTISSSPTICGNKSLIKLDANSLITYTAKQVHQNDCQTSQAVPLDTKEAPCGFSGSLPNGQLTSGVFDFELRRTNALAQALNQQLAGNTATPSVAIPQVVRDFYFPPAFATLTERKAFVTLIDNALQTYDEESIKLLARRKDDIEAAKKGIQAQLSRLTTLHTPSVAEWLLRTMWVTGATRLTAAPAANLLADDLLHKGSLRISPATAVLHDTGLVKMRHHDATRLYGLANPRLTASVNETQEMAVFVYNLTGKNKPFIGEVTHTLITDDIGSAEGEIIGRASYMIKENNNRFATERLTASAAAHPTAEEIIKQKAKELVNAYRSLNNQLAPFVDLEKWGDKLAVPDATPAFHSIELPHQTPVVVPTLVGYSVRDSAFAGQNVPGLAKFEYRVNKLYRFRLKAGLIYSNLNRISYEINSTTNTAIRKETRQQQATAFGVQWFPARIDIRSTKLPWKSRCFAYGGLLLTGNVTENWLVGGGYEPFSGVAFIAGAHFSQVECLRVSGGSLTSTRDLWRIGAFGQVAFGLEAFTTLFINPLKNLVN